MWGLRFINFLHENLGTQFLQGFDKLIVYKLVSELRKFYRQYSIDIGGGSYTNELQEKYTTRERQTLVEAMRSLSKQIKGNYEALDARTVASYMNIVKLLHPKMVQQLVMRLQTIGQLQMLRRLVVI